VAPIPKQLMGSSELARRPNLNSDSSRVLRPLWDRNNHPCTGGLSGVEEYLARVTEGSWGRVRKRLESAGRLNHGKSDIASRAKTVKAVIDFAEALQQFRSRC
jgi:hypothetical protein